MSPPDGAPEVVLALAGHVDHGKSALAGALTDQRTDRRQVEQARGLTVDLGHLVLGGPSPIAMTDVPGHVDYLGNTVVGLAGATHALLVVAADDGWMPQTEDHVRAATQLAVPIPVVAITKVDVVGDARLDAVMADVRRRFGALGTNPTIVPISAVARHGLEDLRRALLDLAPATTPNGAPDLWIDRAFHVEGRGLVVAGTLRRGRLAVGDRVTVAPSGEVGRVRGLQQHGRAVPGIRAPARVAIDLVEATADRGDRVLTGGLAHLAPRTRTVDAWVWSQHPTGIGDRGAWMLHVGSTSVEVAIDPLERQPVVDGADAPVQLRLARAIPLLHGDRVVLRDLGRRVVAGGGVVLDPAPPGRARGGAARRARAATLAHVRGAADPVAALVDADGGVVSRDRVVGAFGDPSVEGASVAGHVLSAVWLDRLDAHVVGVLDDAGPTGAPVDDVVARVADELGAPPPVVRGAIDRLDGVVKRDTRLVRTGRTGDLDRSRRRALQRLHEALRRSPLDPDPLQEMAASAGVAAVDLDRLLRQGKVLRSGPYGFLPPAVDLVIERLRDLEARVGPFSVAQARDVLGVTRKHAVPWVELLDRRGVTVRDGDLRRLNPSAGSSPPSR